MMNLHVIREITPFDLIAGVEVPNGKRLEYPFLRFQCGYFSTVFDRTVGRTVTRFHMIGFGATPEEARTSAARVLQAKGESLNMKKEMLAAVAPEAAAEPEASHIYGDENGSEAAC